MINNYHLGIASDYIYIVVAVYFSFICLFGDNRDKIHSGIILLSAWLTVSVFIASPHNLALTISDADYIYLRGVYWTISLLSSLLMAFFLSLDDRAWFHSVIYLTIFTINYLTSVYMVTGASVAHLFFLYFDELIITVCTGQMVVSYGGFRQACGRVRSLLHRCYNFCGYCYEAVFVAHKVAP